MSEAMVNLGYAAMCQRDREIKRLREVLHEVLTNGEWVDGEQRGDWKISPEVYATAQEAYEQKVDKT